MSMRDNRFKHLNGFVSVYALSVFAFVMSVLLWRETQVVKTREYLKSLDVLEKQVKQENEMISSGIEGCHQKGWGIVCIERQSDGSVVLSFE